MMKDKDSYNEEESYKKMFETSKIKAPENLKYRIMHQIETENVLTRQKNSKQASTNKASANVLKDLTTIFGTMYAVLAVITAIAYFLLGEAFLNSPQFWGSIIFVGSIFSLFWLISRLDANLKEKRFANELNKKSGTEKLD